MDVRVQKIGLRAEVVISHYGVEYLTPSEAEKLAKELRDAAQAARNQNKSSTKFGDH